MEVIDRSDFDSLLQAIQGHGYALYGPTVAGGAIVWGPVAHTADLPIGMRDVQDGGRYRIEQTDAPDCFGYAVGPQSLKNFLHPPRERLFRAEKTDSKNYTIDAGPRDETRRAFVGVRACELEAVKVLDRVLLGGQQMDPGYRARRENMLIVAVNCGHPSGTCFCASMGTGPRAHGGFDLALTEVVEPNNHYFTVEWGSEVGAGLIEEIPHRRATNDEQKAAEAVIAGASERMGRKMTTEGIRELYFDNQENPQWDEVAGRCLTCGNCTMVCPTCFCTTVQDTTDLRGDVAERWRLWDSCFTLDFTRLHGGGSVRKSGSSRYRHWITHKLASWYDQFGTSGCVGCGRCITWCPVGIDITEETAKLRGEMVPQQEKPPRHE